MYRGKLPRQDLFPRILPSLRPHLLSPLTLLPMGHGLSVGSTPCLCGRNMAARDPAHIVLHCNTQRERVSFPGISRRHFTQEPKQICSWMPLATYSPEPNAVNGKHITETSNLLIFWVSPLKPHSWEWGRMNPHKTIGAVLVEDTGQQVAHFLPSSFFHALNWPAQSQRASSLDVQSLDHWNSLLHLPLLTLFEIPHSKVSQP